MDTNQLVGANFTDFAGLLAAGAGVSVFMQYSKAKLTSPQRKLLVWGASAVVAVLYAWLRTTSYLQSVITVLADSHLVYGMFFKAPSNPVPDDEPQKATPEVILPPNTTAAQAATEVKATSPATPATLVVEADKEKGPLG